MSLETDTRERGHGRPTEGRAVAVVRRGPASEVFRVFLRLGLTSFGGPIAHVAYMRAEFVERRRWLDEHRFAQLFTICQFLPGPASSQLGFSIGLLRAGWRGALAAFVAFTLPSALLMFAFASGASHLGGPTGTALVHGLKLVAVVVVAHGLKGMARQLTPDAPRALIAAGAAAAILLTGQAWVQLAVIAAGGAIGLRACRRVEMTPFASFNLPYGRRASIVFLALFAVGLAFAFALGGHDAAPTPAALGGAFYRAGALVFGGGHVVLPLLEDSIVGAGWLAPDRFLAGYGAAQAVPGPMFSLAAYLGAATAPGGARALGAVVALAAIFVPGFLLVSAMLPAWDRIARLHWAAHAMAGVNAAVVGVLAAALYDPVWVQAIYNGTDLAIAVVGFALLASGRVPALLVVGWCVIAAVGLDAAGMAGRA